MPESSPKVFEKHLNVIENSQTAIQLLADACPDISKQQIKLAMKYGAVWMTGPDSKHKTVRVRRAKRVISKHSQLHFYFNPEILFAPIQPALLVADQGAYSVWNKPSGMFSQGTKWGDHTAIARWVELFGWQNQGLEQRDAYLVHRLDRATNGLVLLAHTKVMARQLSALFESRALTKQYSAVVAGEFPQDKLNCFQNPIDGRAATTHVLSATFCPQAKQSILQIGLETGRKHQIRRHLADAGFAIVNDYLYSERPKQAAHEPDSQAQSQSEANLMLRANRLSFQCPQSQQRVEFNLPEYHCDSLG